MIGGRFYEQILTRKLVSVSTKKGCLRRLAYAGKTTLGGALGGAHRLLIQFQSSLRHETKKGFTAVTLALSIMQWYERKQQASANEFNIIVAECWSILGLAFPKALQQIVTIAFIHWLISQNFVVAD